MHDDRIPSNFDSENSEVLMQTPSPLPSAIYESPPAPEIDYTALSKAKVYEHISKNGTVRNIDVDISMIDGTNGSGKATITIGKDIKKRRFEIPISIINKTVHLGKAIDLDTGKTIDISKSSKYLFESPDKERMDAQLLKVYEKRIDFFYGKPTENRIKALMLRFPSLTKDEAKLFLDEQYYSRRPKYYASADRFYSKFTDTIKRNKGNLIILGVGIAALIFFYRLKRF